MVKRRWTADEDEVLRRLYPNTRTKDLALYFGRKAYCLNRRAALLDLKKDKEWVASEAARRLRAIGVPYRFQPGNEPANKGLHRPGWAPGRMRETQFKKGDMPSSWKPVGSTRFSKVGYLQRKVTDNKHSPRDWVGEHILVWEKAHGKVPRGYAVVFKDGDKQHIVEKNLELISRADLMRRNSVHNLPKELATVIQLAGALKRKVRELSEKQTDRPTQSSV